MMDLLSAALQLTVDNPGAALLLIGLAERFLPFLPSSALLVTIGFSSAGDPHDLVWSVLLISTGGSFGALAFFMMTRHLPEGALGKAMSFVGPGNGSNRPWRYEAISSCAEHPARFSVFSQLTPAFRIIAPLVAGAARMRISIFLPFTVLGLILWNAVFLGLGHFAALAAPEIAPAVIATKAVASLLAINVALFILLKSRNRAEVRQCT